MKLFKRWTSGVVSRVDWMVSQVENQEALIASAIRDARQAAAQAKVQLNRVRQDGCKLQQQVEELQQATELWRTRALDCGAEDEDRALQCLKRSRNAEMRLKQMRLRWQEHHSIEEQLSRDVAAMDVRISTLVEKRNLLKTRQSRAQAMGAVRESDDVMVAGLDDVFDRWEARVVEAEYDGSCRLSDDEFEQAFVIEEDQAALREELRNLRSQAEEGGK